MVINEVDLDTAARTLWGEARGEPDESKRAIVWIMRTRAERGGWYGSDLSSVCKMPFQFTCRNRQNPNRKKLLALSHANPEYIACRSIVESVMAEEPAKNPTQEATHFTHKGVSPYWAVGLTPCYEAGNHKFYKGIK